ncbi:MAG: amidase family protein [Balneolaceae bacterium]|nr:amidase family protein [Balneolaceae bacterium]
MNFRSISDIRKAVKSGETTLVDVVRHYADNIDTQNPEINAVVSLDLDQALTEAKQIQQKIDTGESGKLAGAVVGIKDLICEKGKQATCASDILSNFESIYNATVIERLKKEDAILLGRLNMDEFAMGSSCENTIFGPVHNPHDTDKVPGGSSGGSAAAVAAESPLRPSVQIREALYVSRLPTAV